MKDDSGNWTEWSKYVLIELKRLADEQATVSDHLDEIKITLERNTASLEEHVRRTNILEGQIKPLESHVQMWNGGLKLICVLALLVGILEGLYKVFYS